MKMIKRLSLILSLLLLLNAMSFVIYAEAETETIDPALGKSEIPYTAEDKTLSIYGYSDMKLLDAEMAEVAGVTGIEGDYVMQFTSASAEGDSSIMLDLRQTVCKDVKIEDVESVTFRVWIPHKMDLRIRSVKDTWNYINAHTPAEGGGWIKITITNMSTFVDDGNGYFSPFAFTFRNNYNKKTPCIVYFDGVTVSLKGAEPEPPAEGEKPYYTFEEGMGKEEIPYCEFGEKNTAYKYNTFEMMNEEGAKAAGVPEGYSGSVLKIAAPASNGGVGIGLDFGQYRIKDIERITFRVWCPEGTKSDGVRLTNNANNTWIMLADPGATDQWVEVVLDKNNNFNTTEKSFDVFDNGEGYGKVVNFCIRFNGGNGIAYIDSVNVELKAPDTTPPTITYNGDTVINTTAGKIFSVDATAYDERDEKNIAPEYIFSEGAVDENGLLLEGEHTCTVRFTDEAGNSSEINLTLKVEAKDVIAPTLSWTIEKLFANTGMRFMIDVTATDDHDGEVEVVMTWSEGALDSRGRFNEGEHTLTITAVDKTGNKTEKVISVIVTSGLPTV